MAPEGPAGRQVVLADGLGPGQIDLDRYGLASYQAANSPELVEHLRRRG
jgi:hypothetical protein